LLSWCFGVPVSTRLSPRARSTSRGYRCIACLDALGFVCCLARPPLARAIVAMAKGKKPTGRKAAAGKGAGKIKPHKLDPPVGQNVLHAAMLKRIAALEKAIAKLPTSPGDEIEEVKNEIAKLRALPPVSTRLPIDAVQAQAKLRKNGEQILSSLATQVVYVSVKAAVKERWASYGHELIATAESVGEWIANSPPL